MDVSGQYQLIIIKNLVLFSIISSNLTFILSVNGCTKFTVLISFFSPRAKVKLLEKYWGFSTLKEKQVEVNASPLVSKSEKIIGGILGWILPFILMIAVWMFFMRGAGGGKALSFGKSKAKLLQENKQKVTFGDVAGIDEAKEELIELVDFLKDPQKYTKLGAKIPKGCLLIGSPGTGKTLLARAVAGETEAHFILLNGPEIMSKFYGESEKKIRDIFDEAEKNAPSIIFIDEIDETKKFKNYKKEDRDKVIGFDFETYKSFISMSVSDFANFIDLTPEEKRNIINKLFNLNNNLRK